MSLSLKNLVIPPQYQVLLKLAAILLVMAVGGFIGSNLKANSMKAEVDAANLATQQVQAQLEACQQAAQTARDLAEERRKSADLLLKTSSDQVKAERESANRRVQAAMSAYRLAPPAPRAPDCGPLLSSAARKAINFIEENNHEE